MMQSKHSSRTGKKITPKQIGELEQVRAGYSGVQVDNALDEIKKLSPKNLPTPDVGKATIDVFIDDIQRDPGDRMYVDRNIPKFKLDPAWVNPPCYYGDEGQRFDWSDLCKHYVMTCIINPGAFGTASKDVHEYHFENYRLYKKKEHLDGIKRRIAYDPSYIEQADKALEMLYNIYQPSFVEKDGVNYFNGELWKNVIKHFIWCVKWKMNKGEQCLDSLFVNLEGEQGCGKSQFAGHIGKEILQQYYTEGDIDLLGDSFGSAILQDKFIINFDELVKNDVPVEKIKQITTAEKIENRKIMTDKFIVKYIRASFFSTCNKPIYEVINDETGNRRFANFKFMGPSLKENIAVCEELDKIWKNNIDAIWKSVDENRPHGYVVGNAMGELLDLARCHYNAKGNTVRRWLSQTNQIIVSCRSSFAKKLEDVYSTYTAWCNLEDVKPCSLDTFKSRCKQMYTGKNKLAPNKLGVISASQAKTEGVVGEDEINPFAGMETFTPYVIDEKWRNLSENVPGVPPYKPVLEKNLKKSFESESEGGTCGTCGTFPASSGHLDKMDPIAKAQFEQERRRKNGSVTIEYDNSQYEEAILDDEAFFDKLKGEQKQND